MVQHVLRMYLYQFSMEGYTDWVLGWERRKEKKSWRSGVREELNEREWYKKNEKKARVLISMSVWVSWEGVSSLVQVCINIAWWFRHLSCSVCIRCRLCSSRAIPRVFFNPICGRADHDNRCSVDCSSHSCFVPRQQREMLPTSPPSTFHYCCEN